MNTSVVIAQLENLAFEKLFLPARPLIVVPMVARALVSLNRSIIERNRVADEIRTQHPPGLDTLLHHYLGFQDEHGRTDNRYPSYIEAIHKQTDDCIFFAKFLNDDLIAHGEVQRARFYERFGETASKLHKASFDAPQAEGFIPPPDQYADWIGMLVMRPNKHRLLWRTRLRRTLWDRPRTKLRRVVATPLSPIGYSSCSAACCVSVLPHTQGGACCSTTSRIIRSALRASAARAGYSSNVTVISNLGSAQPLSGPG